MSTEQEKMLAERMKNKIHRSTYTKTDKNGNKKVYERYYFNYEGEKYYYSSEEEAKAGYKSLFYGEPEIKKIKKKVKPSSTIEEEIKLWFKDYIPGRKPSTVERCHSVIKNQIIPSVGYLKLLELTHSDVQKMIDNCESTSTAKKSFDYLRLFYKDKKLLKYFDDSPFESIKYEKLKAPKEKSIFLDKEIESICKESRDYKKYSYGYIFYLVAMTGMRIGEARALRIKDFDREGENGYSISIDETITDGREYKDFDSSKNTSEALKPKTKRSNRIIPISEDVFEEFRVYKKFSKLRFFIEKEDRAEEFVFANRNNNPAAKKEINSQFNRILKACHITKKGRTIHSLRHTYATRRIEEGANLGQLSIYLGHGDIRTTESVYVHSKPEEMRSFIESHPMDERRNK